MKINNYVRVVQPSSPHRGKLGVIVDQTGGLASSTWVVEIDGKRRPIEEKALHVVNPPRFKKGARVRLKLKGASRGKQGTVDSSYTKRGAAKCWVSLDGEGGGLIGVRRIDLELVPSPLGRCVPPDPERQNAQRSGRVDSVLRHYKTLLGESGSVGGEDVADLLCDMGHWADRHEEDMLEILGSARTNYEAETGGKGAQFVPAS